MSERRVMEVFFNDREKQFYIDIIQRCYTISYCFDNQNRNCKWNNLPDGSQMVWFSGEQCQGNSLHSRLTTGSTNFEGTMLYKKMSSFMVRQYSYYPVNGIIDYCNEDQNAPRLTEATSTNSSSGSTDQDDVGFVATNSTSG